MITSKTPEEIKIMAEGGKILARIMKELEKMAKPGMATNELNRAAEALVLKYGGQCSFKGFNGYPACLCASINEEIVHSLPSGRVLKEGDILSLDLGIFYKGFHNDMAITIPMGKVASEAKKIIEVTKKVLELGIDMIKPGITFGDIGFAIQQYVESQGFNVVRDLCGHGIGRNLHEAPEIVNYGKIGTGPIIQEGMVFCLEPMVTAGSWKIKKTKDGFGFATNDNSLSCHFEHTLAVTQNSCQVLTKV